MKVDQHASSRQLLGRVSSDTKGPPGVNMEGIGRWVGQGLTR
jgi:hypothetical protein